MFFIPRAVFQGFIKRIIHVARHTKNFAGYRTPSVPNKGPVFDGIVRVIVRGVDLGLSEVITSEVRLNLGFVIIITVEISGRKKPEVGIRNGGIGDIRELARWICVVYWMDGTRRKWCRYV